MSTTTKEITTLKQNCRVKEWKAQIDDRISSGLTVKEWCRQNNVNPKTYYYRLRKVRDFFTDENEQKIVPLKLNLPEKNSKIVIEKNDLRISLSSDVDKDILISVVNALC